MRMISCFYRIYIEKLSSYLNKNANFAVCKPLVSKHDEQK